jgi:hypothetical protein
MLVGFCIGGCLLLGWAISRRSAVDIIAGYQQGDLPPEREQELTTDIRNLLWGVAILLGLIIIDEWTGQLPYDGVLVLVGIGLLVSRITWKYR